MSVELKKSKAMQNLIELIMDWTDPEEFDKVHSDGVECIALIMTSAIKASAQQGKFLDYLVDAIEEHQNDSPTEDEGIADKQMCDATEELGALCEDWVDEFKHISMDGAGFAMAHALVNDPAGWSRLIKAVAAVRRFQDVVSANVDDRGREIEINTAEAL